MWRKLFSGCFSFLFVIIFVLTLILLNINFSIFNVNLYKSAFTKADFYNQLVDKGISYLISGMMNQGKTSLGPISEQNLTSAIKKSLPPTWLKNQLDNIFDQVFNYVTGKTTSVNIVIPTLELKNSLTANLTNAMKESISSLPTCTTEQLKQMQAEQDKKENQNSLKLDCKPSGMDDSEIEKSLLEPLTGKEGLLTKLPEQYNLGEIISKGPTLDTIKRFITIYRMVMWGSLIFSAVLLLLILLINRKYVPGMLKWLCIPLLITALIVAFVGLIGYLSLNTLVGGFIISLPNEFKEIIFSLIQSFSGNLFKYFEFIPVIILLISIIGLIISSKLGKKYPAPIEPAKQ